jgi:hypothetical protein
VRNTRLGEESIVFKSTHLFTLHPAHTPLIFIALSSVSSCVKYHYFNFYLNDTNITIDLFRFHSKGCKYVLFRGSDKNKIATLKRIPTAEELER